MLSLVAGCSDNPEPVQPDIKPESRQHSLQLITRYEDCMELVPEQTIDYSFEADRPVSFMIHYHEGDGVVTVFKKNNVDRETGQYRVTKENIYCLMWTNPGKELVRVSYRFQAKLP